MQQATHHRRHAFTMIELLVTIGIILILVGIVFVALKHVTISAKSNKTHETLGNLKSMLAELDTATKLQNGPGFLYHDASNNRQYYAAGTTISDPMFWSGYTIANPSPAPPTYSPLAAPGNVTEPSSADRNASVAILNTTLAMRALGRVSNTRSALNNMPVNDRFFPLFTNAKCLKPVTNGIVNPSLPSEPSEAVNYPTGCSVTTNSLVWICNNPTAPTTPTTTPPPNAYPANPNPASDLWLPGGSALPVLLDGWGNPIIFVPATGIHVMLLNGKATYDPSDTSQSWIIISPEGHVTGNGTGTPVVDKPGRPFWASAGPDGDFSKGDDNIYSFEQ